MRKRLRMWVLVLICLPVLALGEKMDAFGMDVDPTTQVLDFDANGIRVTDAQALGALLDRLPDLQEVRMYDSPLPREDMEWLFEAYPNVFFGWTIHFSIHTVRTDATAFSTLHYSQLTDKHDDYHTSEVLSVLRLCKRLKALDLGHNRLTDLSFLTGLTELRVLILSPNYSLADLTPIAALPHLEYLELFSTKATDVSALAGLTELRDLNLSCSKKLKNLSPLYALPALERFWCGQTSVSKEQQNEMERQHPDCAFEWVSQPTRGGWREHPRYDIIVEMFRSGQYIPFEF